MKSKGEKGKSKPVSFIFFYVLLPILFALILAVVVLQLIGFNVVGKVTGQLQKVSVVRHILGEPPIPLPVPQQVANLTVQLNSKTSQVKKLTIELHKVQTELAKTMKTLQSTQVNLKKTQTALVNAQQLKSQMTKQAAVYSNMSSTQAAQILSKLPFNTQVQTLQAMTSTEQAAILSQMNVNLAAKLLKAGA